MRQFSPLRTSTFYSIETLREKSRGHVGTPDVAATNKSLLCVLQEIASLREELAIMYSLARAQDRKFDGSEGYAMARRLWTVEKELRIAKEAAASSIVEVYWCLPFKVT